MQLCHLVFVAYFVAFHERKDLFQGFSIAMSVADIVALCLPAVFLWIVYAVIAYTPLCGKLSAFGRAALLVGTTVGVATLAYGLIFFFWLVWITLHVRH